MNLNSIIRKSIAHLVLVVIFYMHVCSALCATSSHGCCGKEDDDKCKKDYCESESNSDHKDNGCQDMHFAFFNTTGQFAQAKADISFKPFQQLVAVITPLFNITPVGENKNIFVYNGFHPPPPKADIRIFISSFQI